MIGMALVVIAACVPFMYYYVAWKQDFDIDVPSIAGPYVKPDFSDFEYDYPEEERYRYVDAYDRMQAYLVQVPENDDPARALIFMHGALGDETEGMGDHHTKDSIRRLRTIMAERGWLYVSPRNADFAELVADIRQRFQIEEFYLAGVSAGGAQVAREIFANGDTYHGAILLCPALPYPPGGFDGLNDLDIPVYLVSGEDDGMIAPVCRRIANDLQDAKKRFHFTEIPDGDHGDPLMFAEWDEAIAFISEGNDAVE